LNALEPGFHDVLVSPERKLVMLMRPVLPAPGLRGEETLITTTSWVSSRRDDQTEEGS
jgi:hypothetical protein